MGSDAQRRTVRGSASREDARSSRAAEGANQVPVPPRSPESDPPLCIGVIGSRRRNTPRDQRAVDFAIARALSRTRGDFLLFAPAEVGASWFAARYAVSRSVPCVHAVSDDEVRAMADVLIEYA